MSCASTRTSSTMCSTGEADVASPRALHPAFHGSFDWHSCVHMHWLLARLLRRFPDLPAGGAIARTFDAHLSSEAIAGEVGYLERAGTQTLRAHVRLGVAAQAGRGARSRSAMRFAALASEPRPARRRIRRALHGLAAACGASAAHRHARQHGVRTRVRARLRARGRRVGARGGVRGEGARRGTRTTATTRRRGSLRAPTSSRPR